MKKYEYKTIICPDKGLVFSPDKKLNSLGSEGWDAIGLTKQSNGDLVVVMKREV